MGEEEKNNDVVVLNSGELPDEPVVTIKITIKNSDIEEDDTTAEEYKDIAKVETIIGAVGAALCVTLECLSASGVFANASETVKTIVSALIPSLAAVPVVCGIDALINYFHYKVETREESKAR